MNKKLFISTFLLIFVSELPDKTALASLLLATRNNPWAVFIGACGAFVVQSMVAVLFGNVFSLLPHQVVHLGTGLLFLVFGIMMWRRSITEEDGAPQKEAASYKGFFSTMWAAFLVIFIAEWGDLTQLASATLVSKYRETWTIFFASTLALWSVTAIEVGIGHSLKKFIEPSKLQKIAALVFVIIGVGFLCGLL